MKAENLRSLERAERMMVRWICGVSLKDRKRSEVLYSLLGFQSVVRRGRLRWNVRLEMMVGGRNQGRGRKTWRECVGKRLTLDLSVEEIDVLKIDDDD